MLPTKRVESTRNWFTHCGPPTTALSRTYAHSVLVFFCLKLVFSLLGLNSCNDVFGLIYISEYISDRNNSGFRVQNREDSVSTAGRGSLSPEIQANEYRHDTRQSNQLNKSQGIVHDPVSEDQSFL